MASAANETAVRACLALLQAAAAPPAALAASGDDGHGHTHGSDDHGHDHGSGDGDGDGDHDHAHGEHGHSHGFCSGVEGRYSVGLHVMATFVVLAASAVGTLVPLLGKRVPALRLPPLVYCVGKCMAVGVMMAVAMIHMINHAAHAFEAECVPASFADQYDAWAFLFAMIAAILMHLIDVVAMDVAEGWMARRAEERLAAGGGCPAAAVDGAAVSDVAGSSSSSVEGADGAVAAAAAVPAAAAAGAAGSPVEREAAGAWRHTKCSPETCLEEPLAARCPDADHDHDHGHGHDHDHGDHAHHRDAHHGGDDVAALECAGHQHGAAVPHSVPRVQRVIAALCMEFGVTLHSVFVGLTLGVTADDDLRVLLTALVFHQLFEGLAMGSRLADAEMRLTVEVLMMLIFSFSAPVGVAAGTAAVSASRSALSSSAYVMVSGVLDSICGGILLYLSFNLLFVDFPADLRRHCARGTPGRWWRMALMFGGLWVGAGIMAFIGKWL